MCAMLMETSEMMSVEQTCPNCQVTTLMHFEGLQWWPDGFLQRAGLQPIKRDDQHPGQGALRLYSCNKCQSSFLESSFKQTR